MTKKTVIRVVCFAVMGLLFAAVLAGNIVASHFSDLITEYFHGAGISYEGEAVANALKYSDQLCREMTEEGIVLLENKETDGKAALPLTEDEAKNINVFGWAGSDGGWIFGSDGSANSNSGTSRAKVKMLTDALSESGINYNTEIMDMYTAFRDKRAGVRALNGDPDFYMLIEPGTGASDTEDAYSAVGANGKTILQNAKEFSNVAIVVLGRMGGEGTDLPFKQYLNTTGKYSVGSGMPTDETRTYLDISKYEEDLLDMVTANFGKVIVLINTCNSMNLNFLDRYDNIDAVMQVNGTGQSGTYAIPKVLKGEVNPSGRMTNTQPYDLSTDPTFTNAGGKSASKGYITYAEDIYVGYKWYETADAEGYWDNVSNEYGTGYDGVVQYPFGYGISYTMFDWELVSADPAPGSAIAKETEKITVQVRVTNTGDVKGKDVVQLYYTPPYTKGGIEKSAVNLVAFAKTSDIEPGKSEVVTLEFTPYDMASYDCYDRNTNRNVGWELDRGTYNISVRSDAHNVKSNPDGEALSFNYNVDKTIRFTTDPVTGERVTNRFTNYSIVTKQEDGSFAETQFYAYGNCAIDGSDGDGADVVYLSRSDFANTFPRDTLGNRTGAAVSSFTNHKYDGYGDVAMPTTDTVSDEYGRLLLYVTESGGTPSADQLRTGKGIKINHDLMMTLGEDYDAPEWKALIEQMSKGELYDLVGLGGYRTYSIESIGKKYMLENDGPSGLNRHMNGSDGAQNPDREGWTMFPASTLLANTWNWSLAYAYGLSVGNEGMATGVSGWYAPGANMQRSLFGGRNCEYYSEDPYLSGVMAAETSRGAINNGMNVYVKHFAVNETETHRSQLTTWLTEQTLRETYLRPFEISVKRGGANGMMSSFNRLGSQWTGSNHALMTDILRTEWGFRGAVVTDYYEGFMGLDRGLRGGNDLWLTGGGSAPGGWNGNDATMVMCAQRSAKNILFARCSSYYRAQTHDKSEDVIVADVQTVVEVEAPFPAWIFIVVGIDVVVVAGIAVWTFFLLKRPRRVKSSVSYADSDATTEDDKSDKEEK